MQYCNYTVKKRGGGGGTINTFFKHKFLLFLLFLGKLYMIRIICFQIKTKCNFIDEDKYNMFITKHGKNKHDNRRSSSNIRARNFLLILMSMADEW